MKRAVSDTEIRPTKLGGNPFARFARGSAIEAPQTIQTSAPCDSPKHVVSDATATPCKRPPKSASSDSPEAPSSTTSSVDSRVDVLHQLRALRQHGGAPVDQFGTDQVVDSAAPPNSQRLHALLGALLSTQTKDEITAGAMRRLHARARPESLTIATLRAMSADELAALLAPVGFYTKKASQVKSVADVLHAKYNDDVPSTLKELTALPGIGPKVARLTLLVAWGVVDGIIVDTHVQRIAKRLGWTRHHADGNTTAESTRHDLEEWVPKHLWGEMSKMMIGFGQLTCTAVKPKCGACPLAPTCPSRTTTKKA